MGMRKLGRGLEALITKPAAEPADGNGQPVDGQRVLQLETGKISVNPNQPRKKFSAAELEELKGSISRDGLLQPVLVRLREGQYELVAGERRLRAARDLGLPTVPAIVIEASDDRMLELALTENIHRADLNPIELAQAFRELLQIKGWTQEGLAQHLNQSRPAVANTLRLLELPGDIQDAIARAQITMGHAKVLLSVSDPREQRLLFEKIAEEKLSVRDLEAARAESAPSEEGKKRKPRRAGAQKSPQVESLEEELSGALGTRVRIRERKGKGTIFIDFYTPDDFDRIRKALSTGLSRGRG